MRDFPSAFRTAIRTKLSTNVFLAYEITENCEYARRQSRKYNIASVQRI